MQVMVTDRNNETEYMSLEEAVQKFHVSEKQIMHAIEKGVHLKFRLWDIPEEQWVNTCL